MNVLSKNLKKSIFIGLTATLFMGGQAWGMDKKNQLKVTPLPEEYQKYAQKCYDMLTKSFSDKKNLFSEPRLTRNEIDRLTTQNKSLSLATADWDPIETDGTSNQARAYTMGIALNSKCFPKKERSQKESQTYAEFFFNICHEITHQWLGHLWLNPQPTGAQKDFEVNTLATQINEASIIARAVISSPVIRQHNDNSINSYSLGIINGISQLKKEKRESILSNIKEKIQQLQNSEHPYAISVKALYINIAPNIPLHILNSLIAQSISNTLNIIKLIEQWEPKETFESANQQAFKILGWKQ